MIQLQDKSVLKPIVILIDNLDRLKNNKALEMLELVKDVVDFPNLTFVLAMDEDYIHSAIKDQLKIEHPNQYLEKIIFDKFEIKWKDNQFEYTKDVVFPLFVKDYNIPEDQKTIFFKILLLEVFRKKYLDAASLDDFKLIKMTTDGEGYLNNLREGIALQELLGADIKLKSQEELIGKSLEKRLYNQLDKIYLNNDIFGYIANRFTMRFIKRVLRQFIILNDPEDSAFKSKLFSTNANTRFQIDDYKELKEQVEICVGKNW